MSLLEIQVKNRYQRLIKNYYSFFIISKLYHLLVIGEIKKLKIQKGNQLTHLPVTRAINLKINDFSLPHTSNILKKNTFSQTEQNIKLIN